MPPNSALRFRCSIPTTEWGSLLAVGFVVFVGISYYAWRHTTEVVGIGPLSFPATPGAAVLATVAGALLLAVLASAALFVLHLIRPSYFELHEQSVILPKHLFLRQLATIPYTEVQSLRQTMDHANLMFVLRTTTGEVRFSAEDFVSRSDFDEFWAKLSSRVGA